MTDAFERKKKKKDTKREREKSQPYQRDKNNSLRRCLFINRPECGRGAGLAWEKAWGDISGYREPHPDWLVPNQILNSRWNIWQLSCSCSYLDDCKKKRQRKSSRCLAGTYIFPSTSKRWFVCPALLYTSILSESSVPLPKLASVCHVPLYSAPRQDGNASWNFHIPVRAQTAWV